MGKSATSIGHHEIFEDLNQAIVQINNYCTNLQCTILNFRMFIAASLTGVHPKPVVYSTPPH